MAPTKVDEVDRDPDHRDQQGKQHLAAELVSSPKLAEIVEHQDHDRDCADRKHGDDLRLGKAVVADRGVEQAEDRR